MTSMVVQASTMAGLEDDNRFLTSFVASSLLHHNLISKPVRVIVLDMDQMVTCPTALRVSELQSQHSHLGLQSPSRLLTHIMSPTLPLFLPLHPPL